MWLEWIDPATSDVISKVKIVVRVTPMKESATCEYWASKLQCHLIHLFILGWVGVWKYCFIRLVDTMEAKEKETVFFFLPGWNNVYNTTFIKILG